MDDTKPRLVSCDEEMPTVVPTGPVRAKAVSPAFEQLGDENPAPRTNPTASIEGALQVRTHRTPRCACVASARTVTASAVD